MKIELIKRISIKGEAHYCVLANGAYVSGTTELTEEKAIIAYNLVKSNYLKAGAEIIKSEVI